MTQEGIVIKSTGSWYTVQLENAEKIDCKLKGKFKIKDISATNPVVVGDRVSVEYPENSNTGLIIKISPRVNYIVRKSKKLSKLSQVIASNIDNALIVATLISPRTSLGFIDRILFTAEAYHIKSILVFNKTDIYDQELEMELNNICSIYSNIGYKCIQVSALRGDNLNLLKQEMKDKTNLFIGHSGVGKSAIINSLQPGLDIKIGDISSVHDKGMHTTTFAEMHRLDFGAYIIDTPGVREFSLIDFDKGEVAGYFPDLFSVMNDCRFKNCRHINEPGCAVKEAVSDGIINESRYNSYLSIMFSDETEIKYDD
jgi:ribosome biogenesis GTPase